MDLHGVVLWLHVVFAILLVGGSAWADLAGGRARRAATVDGARAHLETVRVFVKGSMPLAMGVLLAGIYLTTVGSMWSEAWLLTSLVLFAAIGALAGSQVDPATQAAAEALEASPTGPVPADVAALLRVPALTTVTALFAGLDLAIVFLMTNKPGIVGSLAAAVFGIAVGVGLGMRERNAHTAPAT